VALRAATPVDGGGAPRALVAAAAFGAAAAAAFGAAAAAAFGAAAAAAAAAAFGATVASGAFPPKLNVATGFFTTFDILSKVYAE
jgi:hypothetical protein